MADPITEANTATRKHFMPVVMNQIFRGSPILYKIFRIAQEGRFGLALPSFDGKSIAEPLEIGEVAQESATSDAGTVTTTNDSVDVVGSGASFLAAMANPGSYIELDDGKKYAIASVADGDNLKLKSKYEGTGGAGESYEITYQKDTALVTGAYNKDTTWAGGTGDVIGAAEYAWKMYANTLKIHNLDSEINKGRERIFDLVALKMRNATRRLRKDLITDFYADQADQTEGAMIGLQAIVKKTGLIGGIEGRKHGWWQGVVNTAGSARDLDWGLLNKLWYGTKKYGNADPATLIVMSEGVLEKYEDNLSKVVVTGASGTRYPNINMMMAADKARKTFDGGFEGFSFKHIPMIADPLLPVANKLFFINENYIHWRVLKNFESTGWQQLRSQGKDWAQLTIFGYGALTVSCRRKFGVIEELNES